jgi:hypothetical protein
LVIAAVPQGSEQSRQRTAPGWAGRRFVAEKAIKSGTSGARAAPWAENPAAFALSSIPVWPFRFKRSGDLVTIWQELLRCTIDVM